MEPRTETLVMKDEHEIHEDIKKHLNVDFGYEEGEQESNESMEADPFLEVRSRGMSLQALENPMANNLANSNSENYNLMNLSSEDNSMQSPEMIENKRRKLNPAHGNLKVLATDAIGENNESGGESYGELNHNVHYEDPDNAYVDE